MPQKKIKNYLFYLSLMFKKKISVLNNLNKWENSLLTPTKFYLDAFRFFYFCLPKEIVEHKKYFNKKSRGFGEKALHTMWYQLYNRYQFNNFLEIGVYRGQTISLISLLSKLKNREIIVYGISPFDNTGDTVSKYIEIDYMNDVYANFIKFSLNPPELIKAFSTDNKAVKSISSKFWDCIYIDGSHDYEIVKQDWILCSTRVKIGGVIVLDDSALYTTYDPPFFAFKGHPGPSKVADEIDNLNFEEIMRVGHNRVFKRIR